MATAASMAPSLIVSHPDVDGIYQEMIRLAVPPPPGPSPSTQPKSDGRREVEEPAPAPAPAPVRPPRRRRHTIEAGTPPSFAAAGACPFRALQREKSRLSSQGGGPTPTAPPTPPPRRRRRQSLSDCPPPCLASLGRSACPAPPSPSAPEVKSCRESPVSRSPKCVAAVAGTANVSVQRRRPKFVAPLTPTDDDDDCAHVRGPRPPPFAAAEPPKPRPPRRRRATIDGLPPGAIPRLPLGDPKSKSSSVKAATTLSDERWARAAAAASRWREQRRRSVDAGGRPSCAASSFGGSDPCLNWIPTDQSKWEAALERYRRKQSVKMEQKLRTSEVRRDEEADDSSVRVPRSRPPRRSSTSSSSDDSTSSNSSSAVSSGYSAKERKSAASTARTASRTTATSHLDDARRADEVAVPGRNYDVSVRRRASVDDLDDSISSLEASLRSLSSFGIEDQDRGGTKAQAAPSRAVRKPTRRASDCGVGRINTGNWERAYDVLMARREGSSVSSNETPIRRMPRDREEFAAKGERRR